MKITKVKVYPFRAEREYSTVHAALGGVVNREGGVRYSDFAVIELLTNEGIKGFGEVSDIPETLKMPSGRNFSITELQEYLSHLLVGKDPFNTDEILSAFPNENMIDKRPDGTVYDIVGNGVDNALLDLMGKILKVPVYNLLGGKKRDKVRVSWCAFIRGTELLEQEIAQKVEEGFNAFKLKVGISAELDEERLRIVRNIAGDDAVIKLDANSGWSFDEAVENLKRLEKYNPAGIETPIPYLDIKGKAKLRKKTGIPVIEHVGTMDFALQLIKEDAIDVFNVSTVGSGGILRAKNVLALAGAEGIPCLLGSTVEAGLGTAAQLHLAASSSQVTWPSDLVGPKLYKNDFITSAHKWDKNMLYVPDGNGLGVEVKSL